MRRLDILTVELKNKEGTRGVRKSEVISAQYVNRWLRGLMLPGSRDRMGLRIWNGMIACLLVGVEQSYLLGSRTKWSVLPTNFVRDVLELTCTRSQELTVQFSGILQLIDSC